MRKMLSLTWVLVGGLFWPAMAAILLDCGVQAWETFLTYPGRTMPTVRAGIVAVAIVLIIALHAIIGLAFALGSVHVQDEARRAIMRLGAVGEEMRLLERRRKTAEMIGMICATLGLVSFVPAWPCDALAGSWQNWLLPIALVCLGVMLAAEICQMIAMFYARQSLGRMRVFR